MDKTDTRSIAEKLLDKEGVTNALRLAGRQALLKHLHAGEPVAIWRNGQVVDVPAEELLEAREADRRIGG